MPCGSSSRIMSGGRELNCKIQGCEKPAKAKGLCQKHYFRLRRTGAAETEPYSSVRSKSRFLWKCMPVTETGCWIWLGSTKRNGYGAVWRQGKEILAHRESYRLFRGEIPAGLNVLHSCDERSCVNPDHLRIGTHKENMRDAVIRYRLGKLTKSEVDGIRADPRSTRKVGADYGVSAGHVSAIKRGVAWAAN